MSASPVSRRFLLYAVGAGGLLAAGLLGGCDLDPRSTATAPSPPVDPDQRIVDAARAELSGLLVRLSATPGGKALADCHRQQLVALQGQLPTRRGHPLPHAEAVAREHRASERFKHWAVTCQNGDLARLLASVAAGIRMQPLPGAGS